MNVQLVYADVLKNREASMFDDIIAGLNWLAITIPFFLGYGVSEMMKQDKTQLHIPIIGVVAAIGFAAEYFLYKTVGFPAWMRWFA
jgi:uncharacterized membrane protein